MRIISQFLAAAAVAAASGTANAVVMSPDAIQVVFGNSQPFAAQIGNRAYTIALFAGGAAERTPIASKLPQRGTWRLSAEGFCWKWSSDASEACYTINVSIPANELTPKTNETLVVAGAGGCTNNSDGLIISEQAGPQRCQSDASSAWATHDQVHASFEVDDPVSRMVVGYWHAN